MNTFGWKYLLLSHGKFTGSGGDELEREVLEILRSSGLVGFFDVAEVVDL